ncbi:MAG: hypothetical protein WBH90_17170 [Aggregatilineales bacterium]|nr:hypothetical protein [Aggregatilineales bacterium]
MVFFWVGFFVLLLDFDGEAARDFPLPPDAARESLLVDWWLPGDLACF